MGLPDSNPAWYDDLDVVSYTMIAIDLAAKFSDIPGKKIPYLGKVGFAIQGFKSFHQLKSYQNGNTFIDPVKSLQDFTASGVGTFFGTGGFIGGIQYIIIDETIGIDNYLNSF